MSQYILRIKLTTRGNKNMKANATQSITGEEEAGMGSEVGKEIDFIDNVGSMDLFTKGVGVTSNNVGDADGTHDDTTFDSILGISKGNVGEGDGIDEVTCVIDLVVQYGLPPLKPPKFSVQKLV